jgi:hypothetical protein
MKYIKTFNQFVNEMFDSEPNSSKLVVHTNRSDVFIAGMPIAGSQGLTLTFKELDPSELSESFEIQMDGGAYTIPSPQKLTKRTAPINVFEAIPDFVKDGGYVQPTRDNYNQDKMNNAVDSHIDHMNAIAEITRVFVFRYQPDLIMFNIDKLPPEMQKIDLDSRFEEIIANEEGLQSYKAVRLLSEVRGGLDYTGPGIMLTSLKRSLTQEQ